MADQNKTELTLRVTEAAAQWLAGKGFKPIESEVFLCEQWVADIAAMWRPSRTDAEKMKLIPRGCYHSPERQQAYANLPGIMTAACEVKTSKADFYGDDKWRRESPVDLRILAMPKGMIPKQDWPSGWWILLHSDSGSAVCAGQWGELTPTSDYQRMLTAFRIADRRHNRTAFSYWRDMAKSHRSQENEYTNLLRLDVAIKFVVDYAMGATNSVTETAVGSGVFNSARLGRTKISKDLMQRLDELKGKVCGQ